ncbi:MAG TPA: dienelactone hydrolase family protein [Pseudonocardiaceae bacterium]|jgi:carboxymethylenebutenolidase|nr:dienelactone hydrolase family protein [Pseudonocardiaceae bacterium]
MTQRSLEQILLPDGTRLRLTIAAPESAVRGGIVVGPEAHGVTDAVWQLAAGLAGEGWLAVIPHLSAESVHPDTDAAFDWLARRGVTPDRIGVVGLGLGGAVALIVATQRDLGAAVTIGGTGVVTPVAATLPALVDIAPDLRCPWLGIYDQDGEVPEEEVRKLRDAAHSAQVATDLVHCRFDTDQSVAPEAWARTLNWFGSHLR